MATRITKLAPLALPRIWTDAEIAEDTRTSKAHFVARREAEIASPNSPYTVEFQRALIHAGRLIGLLPKLLATPVDQTLLARIYSNDSRWTAFRYLAGPPISDDDFETILGQGLSKTLILTDQSVANGVCSLFLRALDSQRFPWVRQSVTPTEAQLSAARISTATAVACQRTQTGRRTDEKVALEGSIEEVLHALGFKKYPKPHGGVVTVAEWPPVGGYYMGCNIGEHNADFVVRLFDGRLLAIECKASNSELNSRKRVRKESEGDAGHWTKKLGETVVSSVALRGVFLGTMVEKAQRAGLYVFWQHRLGDLTNFIRQTDRSGNGAEQIAAQRSAEAAAEVARKAAKASARRPRSGGRKPGASAPESGSS